MTHCVITHSFSHAQSFSRLTRTRLTRTRLIRTRLIRMCRR
ncbi:hypothetical protein HMPREF1503_1721 [Olsenella uli MSTE5]|nr:hypothetical protein HMPREF1503_1721 [Olsenella uli MSTE5]